MKYQLKGKDIIVSKYFTVPSDCKICVFLDRDNTLVKDFGVFTARHLPIFMPGVITFLKDTFKALDGQISLLLVTNQSKINAKEENLFRIKIFHLVIAVILRVHGIRLNYILICPHTAIQKCDCRKPMPGLIMKGIELVRLEIDKCIVFGDSIVDLQAANSLRIKSVYVGLNRSNDELLKYNALMLDSFENINAKKLLALFEFRLGDLNE